MVRKLLLSLLMSAVALSSWGQHWSVTWKAFHQHQPALDYVGTMVTKPSDGTGHSRWCIGCETLDRDYGDFSAYKEYVGELGLGYARIQSGWAKTETEKGKYDFSWLDVIVDGLLEEGVKPVMTLCYGNPVYGATKNLGSVIFDDDTTMQAWLKYVNATVRRYKDKVARWEVWNEPNLGENGKRPDLYINLLIATCREVRKVKKDAVIAGISLSGLPLDFPEAVMKGLKKQNALNLIDYVSFHPYYQNPDDATDGIKALEKLVQSYNPKLKLLQGECGAPSNLEWAHAINYREWTEYTQVKWDLRRMACDFSLDIPSSIFTIIDLVYPNMQQSFGLLRGNLLKQPVYKRPSYHGVQNLASVLTADTFADTTLTVSASTARKISCVGLSREGKVVGAMLWYGADVPSSSLEWDSLNLTIQGLAMEEPVFVEPVTGRVYEIPVLRGCKGPDYIKFHRFPLWDCPVLVMERSALDLGSSAVSVQASGSNVKDMLY